MPTRDEQVVQIEAALRARLFPSVPKIETPDRVGWSDADHDKDRLSRCLAAYALVGHCSIDDATAIACISDGKDDRGIDAFFFDRDRSVLVLVQAKFKPSGAAPSQDEILKTIQGIKALIARQFDQFNDAFHVRLDEIEEALDTPGIKIELVVAYLGDNFNVQASQDLDSLKAEVGQFEEKLRWLAAGCGVVHGWLVAEEVPLTVNAEVELEYWSSVPAPRKAVYGRISAASLAELVVTHGKALFERNIRHYLGSVSVNTAIESTVQHSPADLFYLNNGITAVATSISQALGNNTKCKFSLQDLSIVNGAQTAGAIANAALDGTPADDAKLLITIIEIPPADEFGRQITRSRNYQTVVRGVDFAALDHTQERLRQELAVASIAYYYRPSAEARVRRDDAFTLEEATVAIACFHMPISTRGDKAGEHALFTAIDFVVAAKREIGRLWDQDDERYKRLFSDALSGVRMYRCVQLYRFIDRILADRERSETSYERRMFFRHARFFIMALVADQARDIVRRSALTISEADQQSLSRTIDETAELIYARSLPLLAEKGYLSIFRNLTESQPLAADVLEQFRQRNAAQAASQAPAPEMTST